MGPLTVNLPYFCSSATTLKFGTGPNRALPTYPEPFRRRPEVLAEGWTRLGAQDSDDLTARWIESMMATSGLIGTIAIVALGFVVEQATTPNPWIGRMFALVMAGGTLSFLAACWYALRSLGALVSATQQQGLQEEERSRLLMVRLSDRSRKCFIGGLGLFALALLYYVLIVLVLAGSGN